MRLAFNTDPIDESLRPTASHYHGSGVPFVGFDPFHPELTERFHERVASDNAWKLGAAQGAALEWDFGPNGYTRSFPNPWLGENLVQPAPGEPHPAK